MKRLLVLLVGVAVGVLAALVGHFLGVPEWRAQQRAYNRALAARSVPAVSLGLRAVTPPGRLVEERCVTCHLGMVLPESGPPPFQRHPALECRLPIGQWGCSVCHRGEPLGLTAGEAHGRDGVATSRVLDWGAAGSRPAALQPACAQCHLRREGGLLAYDRAIVPEVAAGLDVFLREGCPACHRIAGVHASAEHGPALTAIARRRSREELRDRLLRPQAASPRTPMPPVIVPGEELVRLVRFLEAQTGAGERLPGRELAPTTPGRPRLADHFPAEHPRAPNATAGALFVRRLGCRGCHALGEREAGVPDLSYVGWYRTAKDVREALRDPARRFPGTFMPRPDMPEAVIESLVSYLAARRAPLPSTPAQVYAQACRRCHGRPGARDPKAVVLMGKPPILDPGLARVPRARFLEVVRDGRAGTAMPAWGRVLSPRFIEELAGSLAAAGGRP